MFMVKLVSNDAVDKHNSLNLTNLSSLHSIEVQQLFVICN